MNWGRTPRKNCTDRCCRNRCAHALMVSKCLSTEMILVVMCLLEAEDSSWDDTLPIREKAVLPYTKREEIVGELLAVQLKRMRWCYCVPGVRSTLGGILYAMDFVLMVSMPGGSRA
ncbi:hypothetical protein F2Q68_00046039 [Brassica cretica]|uniref:Uncharacterized protein n=1 Tax=Brassica cretica TaxID=69181 RepID=A0A8S9LMX5_BRACR|nr:hypothetical protein F2Q68_00046039 [Brassica cretica]